MYYFCNPNVVQLQTIKNNYQRPWHLSTFNMKFALKISEVDNMTCTWIYMQFNF